jgi:Leucine-rich repeat (LRR) protein
MDKLQILDLSRNNLERLPDELKAMKSLRVLSVMHNQLRDLPFSIGGLDSLRILKMTGNPLNEQLKTIVDNNGSALSPQTTPIAENEKDALLTLKIKQFLRSEQNAFESGGESR